MSDHVIKGHGVHFYRVDRCLNIESWWQAQGRSLNEFQRLREFGAIYRNGIRLSESVAVNTGDILRIHTEPKRFPLPSKPARFFIVKETAHFLVVNKPAGIPVHPTLDNCLENLQAWLRRDLQAPLFATHRLDVGTEGLIVLAKGKSQQASFMKALQAGRVQKFYSALIPTLLPSRLTVSQVLEHWMQPSKRAPRLLSSTAEAAWKPCQLRITNLTSWERNLTHVGIELLTGRTHQIRAQLAAMGSPVLGDRLYGSQIAWGHEQQWALRATKLEFTDQNERIVCEIPPWTPEEIEAGWHIPSVDRSQSHVGVN